MTTVGSLPRTIFDDWVLLGDKRFQVDCHWDCRLSAAGYSVTRITFNQLDDEPEAVAGDLRVLLYKRP